MLMFQRSINVQWLPYSLYNLFYYFEAGFSFSFSCQKHGKNLQQYAFSNYWSKQSRLYPTENNLDSVLFVCKIQAD